MATEIKDELDTTAKIPPSLAVELIAGSFAGAAQVIVGQPLDTVKTRVQIAPRQSPSSPHTSVIRHDCITYLL